MSLDTQIPSLMDQVSKAGPIEQAAGEVTVQKTTAAARERSGITDGSAEISMPHRLEKHQFVYPEWPTSVPGPEVTLPPPGEKPYPTRTDQMMYAEHYDQERGRPGVGPPAPMIAVPPTPESRGLTKRAGQLDSFGRKG